MAISILDDYPAGTRCGNTCSCCKAGRRQLRDPDGTPRIERVVDLHEHIDYEGHLMICESCVREAAALLGMIDPEMRDEAVVSMHAAQAAADEALAERDEACLLVDLIRGWDGKHSADPLAKSDAAPAALKSFDAAVQAAEQKPVRKPRVKA